MKKKRRTKAIAKRRHLQLVRHTRKGLRPGAFKSKGGIVT